MVLLPLIMGGCGTQAPQMHGDGFPLAKPMDLVHAGATVEARFELPPPWEKDPQTSHVPDRLPYRWACQASGHETGRCRLS